MLQIFWQLVIIAIERVIVSICYIILHITLELIIEEFISKTW